MSQKNDDHEDMKAEYDFRGGVRGKYFARYSASNKITIESNLVANTTSGTESVGAITRPISMTQYSYCSPSPKIEVGSTIVVNAG